MTAGAPALGARRPLARPHQGHLLRTVRGWLVWRALLLGVLLIGLCVARVWLTHQVRRVAYDLSESRRMQLALEEEQRQLEVELATLRDPGRIALEARRRLGMTDALRGQVVILP